MKDPKEIIKKAIEMYDPIHALLLFSGGHDSLCSTHVSAGILSEMPLSFSVYHGDTTIAIKETQDYVRQVCQDQGWPLIVARPPKESDYYEQIIKEHGFPGPGLGAHQFMYRRLKERALKHTVTHVIKSKPQARENVLLISGIRKFESKIRMGYTHVVRKEDSRIWCNPLFWWTKKACENYMKANNLPRNKVKDDIGISGECLCGCFSDKGEYDRLCQKYPLAAEEIDRLHDIAVEHGHPWFWTQGPTEWKKMYPKGQLELGMCVRCHKD
jgi:3'-phosphoadenosine 5'-phosphosulfate sulfotransferase (PAPS reductase)/FAD synthetase